MREVNHSFNIVILSVFMGWAALLSTSLVQAKEKMPLVEETIVVSSGALVTWVSQQKASRYLWQQTAGLKVHIEHPKAKQLSFIAPKVTKLNSLVFELKTTEAGAWKLPHVTTILTVEVKP